MADSPMIFLGIDPSMRYQPYVYAALDDELQLMAIGSGPLREVLAYAAGQSCACAAVNGPQKPNQGLISAEEESHTLFPVTPSKRGDLRQVELNLLEEGVQVPRTPSREKECMVWMRRGFKLYRRLARLGYQPYAPELARTFVEVQADAVFSRLTAGAPLFDGLSLEGRLQRQLILYEEKLPVGDAMKFFEEVTRFRLLKGILPDENIFGSGELNALAAAYTAWLLVHRGEEVNGMGDPREGQIYLPTLRDGAFRPRRTF